MGDEGISSRLNQLTLAEKSAAYLDEPDSDYVLHIHSQTCSHGNEGATLAATSSKGNIRLFSRKHLASRGTIKGHPKIVTSLCFSPKNDNLLYSSSLDKTVACWDMRDSLTKPVQEFEGEGDAFLPLLSLDVSCDGKMVCAGTEAADEDVFVLFWDCRSTSLLGCYSECHQGDITQVKCHPIDADRLATAAMDGLVCVYDISQANEDDALQMTLNTESTACQMGWCGESRDNIFCTTHTDELCVWDGVEWDYICKMTDIKERFKIDYIVDCFPEAHIDDLCVLVGTNQGLLKILKLSGASLQQVHTLPPGGHSNTVRCLSWNSEDFTLVTGGEDAMLCLWNAESSSQQIQAGRLKDRKRSNNVSAKPY